MTIWLICLGSAIAGGLLRQVMGLQDTLRKLSESMAELEGMGLAPITYQSSITPTWLWKVWSVLLIAVIGCAVGAGYFGGWWAVGGAVLCFIGGLIASGVLSNLMDRPRESTHINMAFHSLSNRAADYRKVGDTARADAADQFCALMVATKGLPYAAQGTRHT